MGNESLPEIILKLSGSYGGFIEETGIKIEEVSIGYAKASIHIEAKHLNPLKTVHGGMVFTLIDTVAGTAALTRGNTITTTNASLYFLNPARLGQNKLTAVAKELKEGKNLLVHDVEVMDEDGVIIAKATVTNRRLPVKIEDFRKDIDSRA